MARRFASSTEQEIEKLLEQKDSEDKRRLTKIAKELFHEYLKQGLKLTSALGLHLGQYP